MRALKRLARSIRKRALARQPAPITGGPNKGLQICASAGEDMRTGTFEKERLEFIASLIVPADTVWDIGAHIGYVTMVAAKRCEKVVSFEPWPGNRRQLLRNMAFNGILNVQVVPKALSDAPGTTRFGGKGSGTKKVGGGRLQVELVAGDDLVRRGLPQPTVLKIDVEGHEISVLKGLSSTLAGVRCALVGIHHEEAHVGCLALLREAGFTCFVPQRTEASRAAGYPRHMEEGEIFAVRDPETVPDSALKAYLAD